MASSPSWVDSNIIQRLVSAGLDLLYPPHCIGCGARGGWWCRLCESQVRYLRGPCCRLCGSPHSLEDQLCRSCLAEPLPIIVRSAAHYVHPLSKTILALKYRPSREIATLLAERLLAVYDREGWRVDVVVPVPLSASREKNRGFNQAELVSSQLAAMIQVAHQASLLGRVRRTPSQVGLAPQQRRENVIDAFEARPEVAGLRVLLVDDLYTTGATLRASGTALLDGGAAQVFGVTVARA